MVLSASFTEASTGAPECEGEDLDAFIQSMNPGRLKKALHTHIHAGNPLQERGTI